VLGHRAEFLEHAADERGLTSRVEIDRPHIDRRTQRRLTEPQKRADRTDQHVTPADQPPYRRHITDVSSRYVQLAEPLCQRNQPAGTAAGQHGPQTSPNHRLRDPPPGVPTRSEQHDHKPPPVMETYQCTHGRIAPI
jgi:hypothetical protein